MKMAEVDRVLAEACTREIDALFDVLERVAQRIARDVVTGYRDKHGRRLTPVQRSRRARAQRTVAA